MPRRLGEILRLPALMGGSAGLVWALWSRRAGARVAAALALLGGLAFVLFGFAGLPLIGRYLFLPAAMLAIFFGFAALGWLDVGSRELRRRWAIAGIGLLVAFAVFLPANVSGLDDMRTGIQLRGRMESDLRDLAADPRAAPLLDACAPIFVPNHRPVPILAWELDRPTDDFVSAQLERPQRGIFIAPANSVVEEKFVLDPNDPKRLDAAIPSDFSRVTGNGSWTFYAKDC